MPDGSAQAHTKKTQVLGKACQESNYRTSEMPGRRVLCYRTGKASEKWSQVFCRKLALPTTGIHYGVHDRSR